MRSILSRSSIYISRIQKRMFFHSFVTAFIAAFTQTLAVLIDNVIVCAFYGETEIAAVALANPFFYLLEIPATGLAAGLQAICAKETGAGRIDRANRLFNQVFFCSAIILAVLTVVSFLKASQMAVLFGARGNTIELQPYAAQYLHGLSFEILPYVLFCIMMPVVILDNGGKLISIASACGCATDIVLDVLSVKLGWGLFGIGLASSVSAAVYFIVTILHFLNRNRVIQLRFVRIRLEELRDILVSSAPKAFLSLANALCSFLLIYIIAATGGVVGTCVLSIHGTITYTITIFSTGIAGAVGILAGICYGEKNGEDLKAVGLLAHRYCLILSVGVMAVLAACTKPLSVALTESNASAKLLIFAIHCVIFTIPFSFLVNARISYLQTVRRIREAQRMGIASNLIFLIIGAFLLAVPFGVRGVFMAFPLSQAITLFVSWIIHIKKTGRAFPPVTDYLEVDDSFYLGPGDVISYPIETIEDCALASEQIVLFCRGHKMDARKGILAGLCMEEITTNVIEHGMRPKKGLQTMDIRVAIDNQDIIICVRDGGAAFNLKAFADRLAKEDVQQSGIGLRILLNSAKSISYYRTYGMNTTILTL